MSNKSEKKMSSMLVFVGIGIGAIAIVGIVMMATRYSENPLSHEEACAQMNKLYSELSGFNIDTAEEEAIRSRGGAPTYGEITDPSMQALVDTLAIKKGDVFYDLGSGIGKLVTYMYMATDVRKAIGVELAKSRHDKAVSGLKRLYAQTSRRKQKELIDVDSDEAREGLGGAVKLIAREGENTSGETRELAFIHDDMLEHDLSDANAIFMCATCFSEELLQKLTDKFVKEAKPGLRVVTLKKLPEHPQLRHRDTRLLPTSWSPGSPFHYYELYQDSESTTE